MKCAVKTLDNKEAGQIDLLQNVFGVTPRADILSRVVNWQLSKRQAGTHKTKEIGDISGRKGKPWNQKGTGRARQGSLRSPQFRGGATIFGPVVRSHAYSLNKKVRALGLKMALSTKQAEGKLIVLDSDKLSSPKTAQVKTFFEKSGFKTALIIGGAVLDENFAKAARNIKNFDVLPQQGINVYDILRRDTLILTKTALEHLHERLGKDAPKKKSSAEKPAKAKKAAAPKAAKAKKASGE